jgi:hypothetical protein
MNLVGSFIRTKTQHQWLPQKRAVRLRGVNFGKVHERLFIKKGGKESAFVLTVVAN